jgi:hypothetical protein
LDVNGLPSHANADDLKKISGVKHVILATIDEDAIRNVCIGTGRIKVRLAQNEDLENVKFNFVKEGYSINEHSDNPKKKTNFTQEQNLMTKTSNAEIDAKTNKMQNL